MPRAKTGPGAPKLTQATFDEIVRCIEKGVTRETAVASCGITRETLRTWLRFGAPGDPSYKGGIYERFNQAVREAEARVDTELMQQIRTICVGAERPDWRGLAWILGVLRPTKYHPSHMRVEPEDGEDERGAAEFTIKLPSGAEVGFALPQSTAESEPAPERQ